MSTGAPKRLLLIAAAVAALVAVPLSASSQDLTTLLSIFLRNLYAGRIVIPVQTTFAALPSATNGTIVYCSDCTEGSDPATGGSTGAFALRVNGRWAALDGGGGGGGAPTDATYITQTSNATLSAEQALDALSTGIVKVTTGTGALSTAVAADFPTLNQNTTGTAAALTTNPGDCAANRYATTIAANGDLTCAQVSLSAGVTGTLPEANGGTNQTTYAQGDLLYASGANTLSKLAKGTSGQFLRMNSGATIPEWGVARWWTPHSAGDAGGLNPVASTTYYFGQFSLFDPSTSAASQRMTMDQAATITNLRAIVIVGGTLASAGNVQFFIRKNDTTNTNCFTIAFTASAQTNSGTCSVSLAANDDFTIGFTTPAWGTAPTITFYGAQVWWTLP